MVSIIVPVYNAERFLGEAIDSILRQTYKDFELLLIDDGSTDGSGAVCDEYAGKDARIRPFHKENGGVSSARNFGLAKARGEWCLFVDSDDSVRNDMVEILLSHSAGMDRVVCGYKRILNDGRFKDYQVNEKVCYDTQSETFRENLDSFSFIAVTSVWNGLYRKDSIEHLFNEEYLRDEDFLFNLEYMTSPKRICIIPDILYYYRLDTSGSLTKRIWSDDPEHVGCIAKHLKLLLKDSFKRQENTVFYTIVARTYTWMEFIVRTDKMPSAAKRYIIGNAISKDYFRDPDIPMESYDEKYQKLWEYAKSGETEAIFTLLA